MKSCDEMVNSLLQRREQYATEQKRKRKMLSRAAASICSMCVVSLLGFSLWQSGIAEKTPPIIVGDSVIIGEKDYIEPDELNSGTQENPNDQLSETVRHDPSAASSVASGNYPFNHSPVGNEKAMISSFDIGGMASPSYEEPANGQFCFSMPLLKAMDEYGDSVLYRVVVDVFSEKELLSSSSSQVKGERERLSNNGYVVAYESCFDGEAYRYYFTLHATYDELTEFVASESYGYFMFLYDERVEPIGSNISVQ